MIDEKKMIEEIKSMVRPLLTPDGTAWFDDAIQAHNETIVDVLNAIERQPKVNEWFPVEVVRPAECEYVQVSYIDYNTGKRRCDGIAYLYNGLWYWQDTEQECDEPVCVEITAWRPLGEPYMEEQKESCAALTKDECVKSLNSLYFSNGSDGRDDECYNVLMELIDEHFADQPLKREGEK